MPYTYKKQGDKYVVYKKTSDGSLGKRVGATKGTKEALKKYLSALHMHEEKQNTMKSIKLSSLVNLRESEEKVEMSTEQKKAFLEAVYRFAEHSQAIYRNQNIVETSKYLGELIEAASQLTLDETQDWFDGITVSRHMKHLDEAFKIFEKTAKEMSTLQQRLESSYEDIGETLSKYYDIGGMVNEAQADAGAGQSYQKYFQKAMKKFKIQEPSDLGTDKQKKKFFNWVDDNYTSEKEASTKKDKNITESESLDLRGRSVEENIEMVFNWIKSFGGKDLLQKKDIRQPWHLIEDFLEGDITIEEIDAVTKGNHGQKDGAAFSETPMAKKFFIPYINKLMKK